MCFRVSASSGRWVAHRLGGTSTSVEAQGSSSAFSCGRPERGTHLLSQAGLAEQTHSRKRERRDGAEFFWSKKQAGSLQSGGWRNEFDGWPDSRLPACVIERRFQRIRAARTRNDKAAPDARSQKSIFPKRTHSRKREQRNERNYCFRFGVPGSSPAALPRRLVEDAGWKPAIRRVEWLGLRRPGRARRGGASAGPSAPRRWQGRSPARPRCRRRRNAG